ncbi:MAG: hypothetical protein Kow00127_03900 [Bacteroidales bacterium]
MKRGTLSKRILAIFVAASLIFWSCTKDTPDDPPVLQVDYTTGVFVVNEGPFNSGTGTITWFEQNGSGRIENLFQQANNLTPLGNIVQSMNIIQGKAIIAVNNANLVHVVDPKSFKLLGTVENIPLPRYSADGGNGLIYITSWDNKVFALDPDTYKVMNEIPVGSGPDQIALIGQELWVLNAGGFGVDSTVSVINVGEESVSETLMVYPKPSGIAKDASGRVWILCSGNGWNGFPGPDDTEGHLLCLDPGTKEVLFDFPFPTTSDHPEKLAVNAEGTILFYLYPGGVMKQDVSHTALDLEPIVEKGGFIYGLGADPRNNYLYLSDAGDFASNGWVFRYQLPEGALVDSIEAGIGPNGFCFPETTK